MDFKTRKGIGAATLTKSAGQIDNPAIDDGERLTKIVGIPEGIRVLTLEQYSPGEVEIVNIEASRPGNGLGSMAMIQICAAADLENLSLMLIPAGEGKRAEGLKRFYARFGFEEDGDVMRRPSN
mgnify:CR=1 FL=1